MSVNVSDKKSKFADLKYEQLLAEKYFVNTCFSKKFDSRSKKEELKDLLFEIKAISDDKDCITNYSCLVESDCGCEDISSIEIKPCLEITAITII